MLYFGYGSNLSPTYMALRCPSSIYLCAAFLEGYTWIIGTSGYATIYSSLSNKEERGKKKKASGNQDGEPEHEPEQEPEQEQEPELVPLEKQGVWGSLYSLTASDVELLDRQENAPFSYQKSHVSVTVSVGRETETKDHVLVYTNESRRERGRIGNAYAARINTGIREAALPESYVSAVLRSWVPEDDDEEEEEEVQEVREILRARTGPDPALLEGKLRGLLGLDGMVDGEEEEEEEEENVKRD